MSRIDRNGIVYNSFYETPSELGIEERSEEELIEYKRLIGMPIAEDYDELILCLKADSQAQKNLIVESDAKRNDNNTRSLIKNMKKIINKDNLKRNR